MVASNSKQQQAAVAIAVAAPVVVVVILAVVAVAAVEKWRSGERKQQSGPAHMLPPEPNVAGVARTV